MRSPENLRVVYHNTIYRIVDPAYTIDIDQQNPLIDRWLSDRACHRWAFITADNPRSQLLEVELNWERRRRFYDELEASPWYFRIGWGFGEEGDWPWEASAFILDIDRITALEWAVRWEQYAIVYGKIYEPARIEYTALFR